MPPKLTASAIRRQKERAEIEDLLQTYGDLLTPRQREYMTGFVEGKTFSAMGRESGVSRQAVHEAVRAVQRQLRWYEEKLGLVGLKKGTGAPASPPEQSRAPQAVERLRLLAEFVKEQGIIYSPELIVRELQDIITFLGSPAASRRRKAEPSKR